MDAANCANTPLMKACINYSKCTKMEGKTVLFAIFYCST